MTNTDRPTLPHRDEHGRVVSLAELMVASLGGVVVGLIILVIIDGLLALNPRRTIIFVSHKATVARRASRIVIICDGVAMADGPYRDLVFDERFRELLTDVEDRASA